MSSRTPPAISSDDELPDARRISARNRGNQFLGLERLGQVIVGPGVEPGHLVGPAVARGQHQHRELALLLAPHAQHGQPVDLRQAQIKYHCVVILGRAHEMAILAIDRQIDGVAVLLERGFELTCPAWVRPRRSICAL